MATNDSKSYLIYLNILVGQCNTYQSILIIILLTKNLLMLIILIWLKKFRPILKFKVNERVRISKYKNIFSKGYIENWSREISITDSVLKTDTWKYKIKGLNGENLKKSFCEKEALLSMS